MNMFRFRRTRGQAMLEYALLVVLVSMAFFGLSALIIDLVIRNLWGIYLALAIPIL